MTEVPSGDLRPTVGTDGLHELGTGDALVCVRRGGTNLAGGFAKVSSARIGAGCAVTTSALTVLALALPPCVDSSTRAQRSEALPPPRAVPNDLDSFFFLPLDVDASPSPFGAPPVDCSGSFHCTNFSLTRSVVIGRTIPCAHHHIMGVGVM